MQKEQARLLKRSLDKELIFETTFEGVKEEELYLWHLRPGAFNRLNPPWNPARLLSAHPGVFDGAKVSLKVMGITWLLKHHDVIENIQFCDSQVKGPFFSYSHTHKFLSGGRLKDEIRFNALGSSFIEKELRRVFKFRHEALRRDLAQHKNSRKLKFLITGASGLVGSNLSSFLTSGGHEVDKLLRPKEWDGETRLDKDLGKYDCIVHLAGENIADGRWTKNKKEKILNSRVKSTELLAKSIHSLSSKPYLISASAIGFYGTKGEFDESSGNGEGFLADVVNRWEEAWGSLSVAKLRFGVILSPLGGALKKLLIPFHFGLGGSIGNDSINWISLDDVIYLINKLSQEQTFNGALNVSQYVEDFSKTLGKVLNRPSFFKIPDFALNILFGEMARETLLSQPKISSSLNFVDHDLESYLRFCLGR